MTEMQQRIETAKKPTGEQGISTLERMNQSHESLTFWALDFLAEEESTILDVGCGGGATLARLLEKYPSAIVHGIDYSPEGVALSKEKNKESDRCHVLEGSVTKLPYETESFSLITAFETIYFWEDYAQAFSEIRRVLKENGTFLVCCEMSDPKNPRWEEALTLMRIEVGADWKKELEEAGFSEVNLEVGKDEWICLLAKK